MERKNNNIENYKRKFEGGTRESRFSNFAATLI
jgi:hypothetical protein